MLHDRHGSGGFRRPGKGKFGGQALAREYARLSTIDSAETAAEDVEHGAQVEHRLTDEVLVGRLSDVVNCFGEDLPGYAPTRFPIPPEFYRAENRDYDVSTWYPEPPPLDLAQVRVAVRRIRLAVAHGQAEHAIADGRIARFGTRPDRIPSALAHGTAVRVESGTAAILLDCDPDLVAVFAQTIAHHATAARRDPGLRAVLPIPL